MSNRVLDIKDDERQSSYERIHSGVEITELGIRAICIMYDEHSKDKNSFKNIFRLKNNIYYRLSSVRFQFLIFLKELYESEHRLSSMLREDEKKFEGFIMGNPYFEKIERDLSSIFDGIIFNVISIFDYFSHIICYICKSNKQNTDYWAKLKKSSRDSTNEIGKLPIAKIIDDLDRKLIDRLYSYRSRLIHDERDEHKFLGEHTINGEEVKYIVRILSSDILLNKRYLKQVKDENPDFDFITLSYTAFWLINETFNSIETLLDGLVVEIKSNSHYTDNLNIKKEGKSFMTGLVDPRTGVMTPTSEVLFKQYKDNRSKSK